MTERRANRLARESSPYLLQHAHNPVDWFPWGPEALEAAKHARKPILLSIGYSACHWCHVMERESFEDETTAALMNELFVNIKVDREERPDLDEIYMSAVQLLTGHGGWPMTVFLTPEGEPFYGGTYFPPTDRQGMPSFQRVLHAVAEAYRDRPADVRSTADRLLAEMKRLEPAASEKPLDGALVERAADALSAGYDERNGGIGGAPKFPNTMVFSLFLRTYHATRRRHFPDMTLHKSRKMADGGIYDHLGGGFHRYSVDERWLVPHFEKMLYDNAQLVPLYLDAYRASGEQFCLDVAKDILRYVTREMVSPEGGFYSTQDADSEGEEGKFFVWDRAEVVRLLGDAEAEIFCRVYDVSDEGNFEHRNILHRTLTDEQAAAMFKQPAGEIGRLLTAGRVRLFEAREPRPRPFRDEKVIAAWNGLMLSAYADAYRTTADPEHRSVAEGAARFLRESLWKSDRLLHSWKDGEAKVAAFLDDYAAVGLAFLDLYEATFAPEHLAFAERIGRRMLADFHDSTSGTFFYTAADHERLVTRTRPSYDGSVPSGNSMAAALCLRLYSATEDPALLAAAEGVLRGHREGIEKNPFAHTNLLAVLDLYAREPKQVVIVAPGGPAAATGLIAALGKTFDPNRTVACYDPAVPPSTLPAFAGEKPVVRGVPTAYVCHRRTCSAPVTGWEELRAVLESQG